MPLVSLRAPVRLVMSVPVLASQRSSGRVLLLPVASILPSGLKATLVGPAPLGSCQVRLRAGPSLTPAAVALGLVLLGVGLAPLVVGVGVRLALPLRGGVVGPRNPAAALCRLPADAGGVPPVFSETTRMTAIAAAITVAAAAIAAGFRRDRRPPRAARRPTGRAPPGGGPAGRAPPGDGPAGRAPPGGAPVVHAPAGGAPVGRTPDGGGLVVHAPAGGPACGAPAAGAVPGDRNASRLVNPGAPAGDRSSGSRPGPVDPGAGAGIPAPAGTGPPGAGGAAGPPSAVSNCGTVGRSCGALARQPPITWRSRSSPSPARAGGSVKMRNITVAAESLPNGSRPVPAKASTLPSANTSLAGPTGSPRICSGDMYVSVPTTTPVEVSPVVAPMALAMPKSMIRGPSAARITLPGLRSRCTSPQAWIAARPSASPAPSARTPSGGSGPPRSTSSCSDGPSMNAVTIHGGSACGSASTTEAVWNPPTRRAASISRANRSRNCAVPACAGWISLTATRRPPGETPRNTCPMPPAPSLPTSRYPPTPPGSPG